MHKIKNSKFIIILFTPNIKVSNVWKVRGYQQAEATGADPLDVPADVNGIEIDFKKQCHPSYEHDQVVHDCGHPVTWLFVEQALD